MWSLQFKNKRYVLESVGHEDTGNTEREYRAIESIRLPVRLDIGRHGVEFGIADDLTDARRRALRHRPHCG